MSILENRPTEVLCRILTSTPLSQRHTSQAYHSGSGKGHCNARAFALRSARAGVCLFQFEVPVPPLFGGVREIQEITRVDFFGFDNRLRRETDANLLCDLMID